MRRLIDFPCAGATLIGTLDEAPGAVGVLIVSGGNEPRTGAHRGMATLAQQLAAAGIAAFRFDRRGVGDSNGRNDGWTSSAPDIAAAMATFRAAQPHLHRVVGLGNCDGATALALFGEAAGIDALVLTNPWLSDDSPLPPPAAVRSRYARRLIDAAAWRRLLTSRDGWRKLAAGLRHAASTASAPPPLADRVAAALAGRPATIVLACGDRTARFFAACWRSRTFAEAAPPRLTELDTDSHSFVGQQASLQAIIMDVVAAQTPPQA